MICMACSSPDLGTKFALSRHRIVQCRRCGVMFNETYYEDEGFRAGLFTEEYYDEVQSEAFRNRLDRIGDDPSVKVYKHYLERLEETVEPGDVLDVGCAFGSFLKIARDRGWSPKGVEVSEYSSAAARERWGLEVFTGDLENAPFPGESFDLVTFWDVIEHVQYPRRNLETAHRLLRPGGRLLVTTDNFFSLFAFLGSLAYRASLGRITYPVERFYIPHNSCYFTHRTFLSLCDAIGFNQVFFEKIDYPIEKLNLAGLEKLVVRAIYMVGDVIGLNSQFISILEKRT